MSVSAIIIEIRAGAGGEEAALFARNLFDAYSRYAQKNKWPLEIFDQNITDLGGYRKISFRIISQEAWNQMKFEGGTHRVQRIPYTEKAGRIQTSTITVSVCSQQKSYSVKLNPAEVKIDFYRSSGPGGQNVNKRETAVRLTHIPSNLIVTCQSSRSQQKNKELAFSILLAQLVNIQEEKEKREKEKSKKSQIGSGERSEKIRTYHFPRNQITDHRINQSWHNLEDVMKGDFEQIFKILTRKIS
jgi:peptide chain release factor 1